VLELLKIGFSWQDIQMLEEQEMNFVLGVHSALMQKAEEAQR